MTSKGESKKPRLTLNFVSLTKPSKVSPLKAPGEGIPKKPGSPIVDLVIRTASNSGEISMSELVMLVFNPWIARTLAPSVKSLAWAVMSNDLRVVASPSAWLLVASEFQTVVAGALALATRTPLRKATKPSSYFIFSFSLEIEVELASSKGMRR